jgi:outer membrane protein assembly factor BamB
MKHQSLLALLTAPLLVSFVTTASLAQGPDWPQWRGQGRDGVVQGSTLPAELPAELNKLFEVEVGSGHSSPVVVGEHIYLHTRQGEDEVVQALELRTGKTVWRHSTETPYRRNPAAMSHGKGPKSTPVVSGDNLCTLGITGRLTCFDRRTGDVRFTRDFQDRFERTWPDFGTAMSPAVFDGKLIVHVGGVDEGALVALDPTTGEELWSNEVEPPAYASPILVAPAEGTEGDAQVVTQTRNQIVSVALDTGKLLWQMPLTTAYEQNSVTAVSAGSTLIVSGLDRGVFEVRAQPDARGLWMALVEWRNDDLPMYMSSPVLFGTSLFGLTHKRKGQLFCLDAETGDTKWTTEGRDGENASLIIAGDRLLVVTTDSELIVAEARCDSYTELARYTVASSPVWAHPALVGDLLLIKDEERLIGWSFR